MRHELPAHKGYHGKQGWYRDDVEITTHKDIEDKDQTVTITPPPDIPKTGDTTNIPLWGALTGISLLGAGVVAFCTFRKKKEENEHERYRGDVLGVMDKRSLPEWAKIGLQNALEIRQNEKSHPNERGEAR